MLIIIINLGMALQLNADITIVHYFVYNHVHFVSREVCM